MATGSKTLIKETQPEDEPDPTLVARLRRMCPHFFTDAIERNRKSAPAKPKPKPLLWGKVTRDLGRGCKVFVHLHIDVHLRKFEFRDNSGVQRWPVDEKQLELAISSGGRNVGIVLGTDTLRLNRDELLTAFNDLRALRTK